MRGNGRAWHAWFVALSLALAMTGCHTSPQHPYDRAALAGESFTANHPGLVLGGPAAHQAAADDAPPWWFSRNDGRLNIREGAAEQAYEATRVETHDRQFSRPGRIHDTYRRSARSWRSQHLVR